MIPTDPPATLSHYRVLARLGAGGMGELFVAMDETLQRRVVLKAIRAEHRLDPPAAARFLREARALSLVDHPGICRIYDYLRHDTGDFLVLELIEGEDLRGWVDEKRPLRTVLDVAEQMVSALAAAHAAGIVHRDLKPANVMVTPTGQVKVLDFGLARAEAETEDLARADSPVPQVARSAALPSAPDAMLTRPGTTLGTLRYMSPEQARGEPVTTASDMFSFGVVLREFCTGRAAHPADLAPDDLLERVSLGHLEPVQGLRGDVATLIARLLQRDPRRRPTANETLVQLRSIQSRSVRWLRPTAVPAAALVLVGAASKYTLDLGRAHKATLHEKAKAEDLVEFMLGDLHTKLETVGRLELLEDAVRKALDYYSAQPEQTLSDADRMRRSRALVLIGKIGISRGGLADALALLERMHDEQQQIVDRSPQEQEWRFELAQTHFWIGTVHFLQDDLAGAEAEFVAYRQLADELHSREPGVERWDVERAYALTNLAVTEDRREQHDQARQRMEDAVSIKRELAARHPDDAERGKDLINGVAWLADLQFRRRDLAGALARLQEQQLLLDALLVRVPKDMEAKAARSVCLERMGQHLLDLGRVDDALRNWGEDLRYSEEMVALDPANVDWVEGLAQSRRNCARLQLIENHDDRARELALGSRDLYQDLLRRDAGRRDWLLGSVKTGEVLADLELHGQSAERARQLCDEYLGRIDPHDAPEKREPPVELMAAKLRYLRGRCTAALGEQGARDDWTRAREAVAKADAPGLTFERLDTELQILAALGEHAAAREIADQLRALGYRNPKFEQLCRQERL